MTDQQLTPDEAIAVEAMAGLLVAAMRAGKQAAALQAVLANQGAADKNSAGLLERVRKERDALKEERDELRRQLTEGR